MSREEVSAEASDARAELNSFAQNRGENDVKPVSANDVRSIVLGSLEIQLAAFGLSPDDILDDFDLLTEGVVDSLGILEMIASVEKHFGMTIDFEDLTPENLTIVGPFCRYVAEKSAPSEKIGQNVHIATIS